MLNSALLGTLPSMVTHNGTTNETSGTPEVETEDAEFTVVEPGPHVERLLDALDAAILAGLSGWTTQAVLENARKKWGVDALDELTPEQVETILSGLEKAQATAKETA